MEFRAVILAAGLSRRAGAPKLFLPFRGAPLIAYAIEAARTLRPVVVARSVAVDALHMLDDVEIVVNDEPERGMTHSLALGNAALPPDAALVVVLGDKPLVTPALIQLMCDSLRDAAVAYPVDDATGAPGHPVVFSPVARRRIAALPDGDSLHALRDDPALTRHAVPTSDRGAFFDIDTAEEFERP